MWSGEDAEGNCALDEGLMEVQRLERDDWQAMFCNLANEFEKRRRQTKNDGISKDSKPWNRGVKSF